MRMKDIAELERVGVALRNTKRWTFTEDEKIILRNFPKEFKWIARDSCGCLYLFLKKPSKNDSDWDYDHDALDLECFDHIFKSIRWEDKEACEFRKYL